MNLRTTLLELLLGGFFAIACFRASAPAPDGKVNFRNLFRLTGRLERLQKSRWQWFSMVALMLVLRLQDQLPLILELTAFAQFALFMALPAGDAGKSRRPKVTRRRNEVPVASR